MSKEAFLSELGSRLAGLGQDDIDERISFYSEMIDDRIEDGLTEEEAVDGIGTVDSIVRQIMSEIPLTKLVKERVKPKQKLESWKIVLIVLTFPIWFSLAVAAASVVFSVYVAIWSIVISLFATDLALALSVPVCIFTVFVYLKAANPAGAFFSAGAAVLCAGLAILLFFGCVWISRAVIKLTKGMILSTKYAFVGKEDANR